MIYIENNWLDFNGGMYLTADSLIEKNNIITGSNNITLRKTNVKSYGFDKISRDKDLIENRLCQ